MLYSNYQLCWISFVFFFFNQTTFHLQCRSDSRLIWIANVAPWCSVYHYYTTWFNKAWTQVLRRFKCCSRCVRDSRWWESLIMVPVGNKAKRLSSVNHTTKTIHHHHHHQTTFSMLLKWEFSTLKFLIH